MAGGVGTQQDPGVTVLVSLELVLRLRCSTREAEAVSWSATRLRRSPVVTVVWLSSLASRMVGNCPGRWL